MECVAKAERVGGGGGEASLSKAGRNRRSQRRDESHFPG